MHTDGRLRVAARRTHVRGTWVTVKGTGFAQGSTHASLGASFSYGAYGFDGPWQRSDMSGPRENTRARPCSRTAGCSSLDGFRTATPLLENTADMFDPDAASSTAVAATTTDARWTQAQVTVLTVGGLVSAALYYWKGLPLVWAAAGLPIGADRGAEREDAAQLLLEEVRRRGPILSPPHQGTSRLVRRPCSEGYRQRTGHRRLNTSSSGTSSPRLASSMDSRSAAICSSSRSKLSPPAATTTVTSVPSGRGSSTTT
jgi:hypothetical protein